MSTREELLEDDVRTLEERCRQLTAERDAARDQVDALGAGLTEARSLLEEQARVYEALLGEWRTRTVPVDELRELITRYVPRVAVEELALLLRAAEERAAAKPAEGGETGGAL